MLLPSSGTWGWRDKVVWASWLILLLLLPITSQPWVAAIMGGGPVSPPSALPALVIGLVGLAPYLLRRGRLPRLAAPLIVFACLAALSTCLSPWLGLSPFKGQDVFDRGLRSLATLAIGLMYYLAASLIPADGRLLRRSLIAISIAAVPMLLWSSMQIANLAHPNDPPLQILEQIHAFFSLRPLFRDRVTGLAYEPSWLADQLVILYLPLWTAFVVRGVSVAPRFKRLLSLELVLLAWGLIVLMLSFSRIGVASWFLVMLILALAAGWRLGPRLAARLGATSAHRQTAEKERPGGWTRVLSASAGVLVVLLLLVLTVVGVSRFDERVARVFQLDPAEIADSRHPPGFVLANRLKFAERVMYWTSASRVFGQHPVLGVGLGNTGFYFPDVLPSFGYALPEMLDAVDPGSQVFPNPKSLWFRLLSETGVAGFVLFITWLIVVGAAAGSLHRRASGLKAAIGTAAILSLTALLLEAMSLDTFALPYLWILPGLATAAWGDSLRERIPAVTIGIARCGRVGIEASKGVAEG